MNDLYILVQCIVLITGNVYHTFLYRYDIWTFSRWFHNSFHIKTSIQTFDVSGGAMFMVVLYLNFNQQQMTFIIIEVTIKSMNNWIHWTNYWNCLLLTKWVKLFNLGHIESACSWSDNSGILMVSLISWIIRCKP